MAGKLTHRVRALLAARAADVLPTSWLRALPPARAPAPLPPLHALALAPPTRLALARHYDAYGDHYTEPIDDDILTKIFQKMDAEVSIFKITTITKK